MTPNGAMLVTLRSMPEGIPPRYSSPRQASKVFRTTALGAHLNHFWTAKEIACQDSQALSYARKHPNCWTTVHCVLFHCENGCAATQRDAGK